MQLPIILSLVAAVIAIIYGLLLIRVILKKSAGNEKMQDIAKAIQQGAKAYLNRQYKTIAAIGVVVFILLAIFLDWKTAIGFVVGAILSGLTGYIGMNISVRANVRTTEAARGGLAKALDVAVKGGSVTGLLVVGLGLLGVAGFYAFTKDVHALIGLGFGGSLISIFARAGGGIFTKAADVGADLVGKLEAGIPEDSPRNPAVIADNVGDNVGDVAGMGADLFESFVGSIIAAMTLGMVYFQVNGALLPVVIAAAGILASIIGTSFVRTDEKSNPMMALNAGTFGSAILMIALSYVAVKLILPQNFNVFWSLVVGVLA